MIKSKTVNIKKTENFDNLYIEKELKMLNYDVVRWAVIKVDDNFLKLSISLND